MTSRLFIQAMNVHQGGGKVLLNDLLAALPPGDVTVILDNRMAVVQEVSDAVKIHRIKPTIWQRLKAEWWVSRNLKAGDQLLCFGGHPPIFRCSGEVLVFVQNRYLIEPIALDEFSFKTRLRIRIERLWFAARVSQVNFFIVQSPSMKASMIASGIANGRPVWILPFMNHAEGYQRAFDLTQARVQTKPDFLYVASGEPHKNHRRLVEAWCLLAEKNIFPTLKLTINQNDFKELCDWIEAKIRSHNLRIENLGSLPHDAILANYKKVGALIYPSTFESFGLPLIEARRAGLHIIASELDYVRDIIDPEQSFDPKSPVSIARAVERFLGIHQEPIRLLNAGAFVEYLIKGHN